MPIGLVEVEMMEIEDTVHNSCGELPPPSLEQINLRSEEDSGGGVATQEPAPPI